MRFGAWYGRQHAATQNVLYSWSFGSDQVTQWFDGSGLEVEVMHGASVGQQYEMEIMHQLP